MAIAKLVLNSDTQIDLTTDTVASSDHIMEGYVGHLRNGTSVTGTGKIAASEQAALDALVRYSNEVTGESDTTISEAVETLVDGYGQGGSEEELLLKVLDRTISGDITINSITAVGYQAFSQCTGLRKVSLPNCTVFNSGYVFNGCANIEEYYLPKLNACYNQQVFTNPKVKCVVLPALPTLNNNLFYASNPQLEKVDMLGGGLIRSGNFRNYSALSLLIFRNTSSITTLYDLNGIETTKFGSNGSGGTIYVPQALISSYQADSKWSTILGYTNNRILKIEDSEYELYYADGSLIETY